LAEFSSAEDITACVGTETILIEPILDKCIALTRFDTIDPDISLLMCRLRLPLS